VRGFEGIGPSGRAGWDPLATHLFVTPQEDLANAQYVLDAAEGRRGAHDAVRRPCHRQRAGVGESSTCQGHFPAPPCTFRGSRAGARDGALWATAGPVGPFSGGAEAGTRTRKALQQGDFESPACAPPRGRFPPPAPEPPYPLARRRRGALGRILVARPSIGNVPPQESEEAEESQPAIDETQKPEKSKEAQVSQ
jgi:hypothetical protein